MTRSTLRRVSPHLALLLALALGSCRRSEAVTPTPVTLPAEALAAAPEQVVPTPLPPPLLVLPAPSFVHLEFEAEADRVGPHGATRERTVTLHLHHARPGSEVTVEFLDPNSNIWEQRVAAVESDEQSLTFVLPIAGTQIEQQHLDGLWGVRFSLDGVELTHLALEVRR